MAAAKVMRIIQSILYELQPFRLVDVVDLVKYIVRSTWDLSTVSLIVSDLFYKNIYEFIGKLRLQTWGLVLLWAAGWALMVYAEFGSLWILLSMFASIFLNLGKRKKGELSAYSVFNEGFKQLLGTLNAEQFDQEIRHTNGRRGARRDIVQLDDVLRNDGAEDDWLQDLNQRHNRGRGGREQRAGRDMGNVDADGADGDVPRLQRAGGAGAKKKGKGKKASRRTKGERQQQRDVAQEQEQERRSEEEKADGEQGKHEGEVEVTEAEPDTVIYGAVGADGYGEATPRAGEVSL
jgi:hypothetical protein